MKKFLKIFGIIILLALCAFFIYKLTPYIKLLYTEEGRVQLNEKIESYGVFAPLVFIAIEVVQIIAAFIPGAPVEMMSGILFGSIWGIVFCFIGVFIGTVLVFYLVRFFGKPLVEKIFPNRKFENIRILNDEKRLSLLIFILFLIPGTPKDFLTYIAALTKIKPCKFFFIAAFSRTPSMACSVLMGSNLGKGRYEISIILFVVICILSVVGYFLKDKLLEVKKNHLSKK